MGIILSKILAQKFLYILICICNLMFRSIELCILLRSLTATHFLLWGVFMDLSDVDRIDIRLTEIWDDIKQSWKDDYSKKFEEKTIVEMKNILFEVHKTVENSVSEFELFKNTQKQYQYLINEYKQKDNLL